MFVAHEARELVRQEGRVRGNNDDDRALPRDGLLRARDRHQLVRHLLPHRHARNPAPTRGRWLWKRWQNFKIEQKKGKGGWGQGGYRNSRRSP